MKGGAGESWSRQEKPANHGVDVTLKEEEAGRAPRSQSVIIVNDHSHAHRSTMCIGVGKWGRAGSPTLCGARASAVLCLHPPPCLWDLGCSVHSEDGERECGRLCLAG